MVKRVTIKDVAREAGVSIALVSFVMNRNNRRADGKEAYRVSEEIIKSSKPLCIISRLERSLTFSEQETNIRLCNSRRI